MAAIFQLPKTTLFDASGLIIPGGKVSFYDAGTTTPRAVYSDSGLTTPISQPVTADAAGRLPLIFMSTGSFKIAVTDADNVSIYTADNLDSGIPAGSGALAVANGGTAATTAAGARTNLGAASQTEVDALSSSVAAIESQITGVGGTLGDLAGLDQITRSHLATGFGSIVVKRQEVNGTTSVVTCTDTVPYDNSIPQNSEGTQFLTGSYTPVSASSTLEIEVVAYATPASAQNCAIALFRDTGADAIAAGWTRADSGNMMMFRVKHHMNSWGTSASTLAARGGAASGNFYINGNSSGTRVGGGILRAFLRVTEYLSF